MYLKYYFNPCIAKLKLQQIFDGNEIFVQSCGLVIVEDTAHGFGRLGSCNLLHQKRERKEGCLPK